MIRIARTVALTAAVQFGASLANADPAQNGSLVYGPGSDFKTVVYEPRLLGLLHAEGREPYLVFSGLGCAECDINRSVYIHSPSDSPMESGERGDRYSHPGKYYDAETNALYETVRLFVGRCLPDDAEGAVWFSNSKLETGQWKKSTFVARVVESKLVAAFAQDGMISLTVAQAAVARKVCKEVPGVRFTNEP